MQFRKLLQSLLPSLLFNAVRRAKSKKSINILSGDYVHWADASAASTGYASDQILQKTINACLQVKIGNAVFERDSILFDTIHYSWPLLTSLMWTAARCNGRLNVLDFGGSLGSTYYQNRRFLNHLPEVVWNIIEQESHVRAGQSDFQDGRLKFYFDIESCLKQTEPNVVLFSSVLQYLENPFNILKSIIATPCRFLIIDRTPFWDGSTDRLCVQNVPPEIYTASYPSWIFSSKKFHSFLMDNWKIIETFSNSDYLQGPIKFCYQGLIAQRRPQC